MNRFSFAFLLSSFSLFAQNSDKVICELLTKINILLLNEHFKPKPIDDSLSVYVFDTFIESLDAERNIFLKSEYDTLSKLLGFLCFDENYCGFISSDNCKEIEIILRKKNGIIYSKKIKKKIMKAREHSVYSFIIDKRPPIGYLKIPSFYNDFDGDNMKEKC